MITNFKIFEAYSSKKEEILNFILDKIQKDGKDSLSADELNYLKEYPDGDVELYDEKVEKVDDIVSSEKTLKTFSDDFFKFDLYHLRKADLTNSILIIGKLFFPNNKIVKGSFEVNLDTQQIQPSFYLDEETAYDIVKGHEYELDNFLENTFLEIMDDMEKQ